MNCIWRQQRKGYYICKNCRLPAATTKLFLDRLPPKRNCTNPRAQFLLGDFLERLFLPLSDDTKLRWGKRLDILLGTPHVEAGKCNCYTRKHALNEWTLRIVALPWHTRPFVIARDISRIISRI